MNKRLFESIMKLNDDTGTFLSNYLGIGRSTFFSKISETNGAEFTQGEISMIREKYNLSAKQIYQIFLCQSILTKHKNI